MKKLTNVKLLPISNPNYQVKESVDELIKLCREKTIYIIKDRKTIIGITDISKDFYESDGFICGDIYYDEDKFDLTKYEWNNAEVVVDNDMNIKRVANIVYKEINHDI